MSIFQHYKAVNDLIHNDDDLEDLDAPVKVELSDGRELLVNGIALETNEETGEQVVWLKAVEE